MCVPISKINIVSSLSLEQIRQSIDGHVPDRPKPGNMTRQAAVAAILRSTPHYTEALFILRAQQEGDPWSGHMAFPGGHRDEIDRSLRHTAERETLEEIGLDLSQHASFLGELDTVVANPRGRTIDMAVTPFVYELHSEHFTLDPNHEVADVLWGSLDDMMNGRSLTSGQFMIQGRAVEFPGYDVAGHIVWGLTFRMLEQFFVILDPRRDPG
jgi:8-oxo-dGTP pyrophosphatase MutT (NUDIX family)